LPWSKRQGVVVTYVLPLEVFVTGIKTESSDQRPLRADQEIK